ncbi:MAG: hypothetical protein R3223_08045 [Longimicrobiales bacterium]|nr:hypothetical protein [Longimicrobiales bacterium]
MAEADSQRIRITLRWIKILDNLEPFFDDEGEFQFTVNISSGGKTTETRVPEQGFYSISDRPGWNFVELNRVIFDGEVGEELTVEIQGEELDNVSANDQLETYRRKFEGSADDWYGVYKPHDEGEQVSDDPEALSNWQLCYVIERA